MPLERRQRIIEIARQYDVTIIEDDVFGFLMPEAPPPMQTLAPDITLHISSLSKSIAPGLRIGYLVAPSRLMPRLEGTMRALNYAVPPLMSELASRWIEDGSADRFADTQRRECLIRHAMAQEILRDCPVIAVPSVGQHLWLKLPEPWRREDFVSETRQRGVMLTGADVFMVGRGAAPHAVRVGLSMPTRREDVRHGLEVIAELADEPGGERVDFVGGLSPTPDAHSSVWNPRLSRVHRPGMVQRAMALAVSRCLPNRLIDVVPCPRHRFRQGQPLRQTGRHGGGQRAAGAVGVDRIDARGR